MIKYETTPDLHSRETAETRFHFLWNLLLKHVHQRRDTAGANKKNGDKSQKKAIDGNRNGIVLFHEISSFSSFRSSKAVIFCTEHSLLILVFIVHLIALHILPFLNVLHFFAKKTEGQNKNGLQNAILTNISIFIGSGHHSNNQMPPGQCIGLELFNCFNVV